MNTPSSTSVARRIQRIGFARIFLPVFLAACLMVQAGPPSHLAAQAEARGWEAPRTEWGDPDLRGNWSNETVTPFQRPVGQEPILTWEEVARIEAERDRRLEASTAPADPDRPPPPEGGTNHTCIDGPRTCYDQVYLEGGGPVAVVRGEPRSSLVTLPPDGRVPGLTDAAARRIEQHRARTSGFGPYDHPEVLPLQERCIVSFGSSAGPPMLPNYWYNNNYTIAQNADHVLILAEMVHDARIIRLGEPRPLPPGLRPWFGDSWGRWEGGTLVVETTNIHPEQTFRGVPPSTELRVIERFTRTDEETILYEFLIDDPSTYEERWGGEIPFRKFDDVLYEYSCHEGNYSIENTLRGARFQEERARR